MEIEYSMKKFFEEIIRCLVEYGNLDYEVAKNKLYTAGVYDEAEDSENVELNPVVGHETPYFWAMHILYGENNSDWADDPKLWPPPEKEMRAWYGDDFVDNNTWVIYE